MKTPKSMENQNSQKTKIEKLLSELYYSLQSPVSYAGAEKLYQYARKKNNSITRKDVKNWLRSQLTYTLHKPVKLKFSTRPVMVYDIDEQWQMDLVDLSKLSKFNSGYKYLLVCVDILSKFLWIRPLKSKTGEEAASSIKSIFSTKRIPKVLQTDKGTEFFNILVKKVLAENNVKLIYTNSERKASVVERLNRTFKGLMYKYFTKTNNHRYIDVLQDLVEKYNNTYHRMIKMKPKDVNKQNVPAVWINLYEKRIKPKKGIKPLTIGQHVRISIEKTVFQKRYGQLWTEEVFLISHVILGNPIVYKLKDQAGEPLNGSFYREELQMINEPSTYRIEKVLRSKKSRDGKKSYFVKWKGYPDKFNSFVSEKDLHALT